MSMLGKILNGGALMKTVSIFLSLINSLLAGVILLASLTGKEIHEAAFLWLFIKILSTIAIIFIGILTWWGNITTVRPNLLTLSSLSLVALGAATRVWTFYLDLVTGDMEYYMVVYGASLLVQGVASLFGIIEEARNMRAA
jgi:hypothetical protein